MPCFAVRPAPAPLNSAARSPWAPRLTPHARTHLRVWAAAAYDNGSTVGGDGHRLPGFMRNPAIAKRELLRQFYAASSSEEQLRLLQRAAAEQPVDLGTSLQMLCHAADLSQKGMLPGSAAQQAQLVHALHGSLLPALPAMQPLHLATALWAYAAVGVTAEWTDDMLQQIACQELAAGRLGVYNTKDLTSLLFAYGRLMRQRTPEVQRYGAELAAELAHRLITLPYIRSNLSATDFADLAEACATLFGGRAAASDFAAQPSITNGSSSSNGSGLSLASSSSPQDQPQQPPQQPPPAAVTELLDELATEVRRQLANKHSSRSIWAPRDLVRLAQAYAALGHHTPRACQMLDVLSSFCVQRIKSRHLNCVSRPADLAGLLQAYADLQHVSVVVPELLAAVGEQVRRGAARQQEELTAAAAADTAATAGQNGGQSGQQTVSPQQQQQHPSPPGSQATGFSLPVINSLLDSHIRLGYCPPPLLLQCLAPEIRRKLPCSSAGDAATMLQLLAAVPVSPGGVMVELLLGRVLDEAAGTSAGSSTQMVQAARQAADTLLGSSSSAHAHTDATPQ